MSNGEWLFYTYGSEQTTLSEMVNKGIVPAEIMLFENKYICTWDIETHEEKILNCAPVSGMKTEANLKLLSIAVGSNLPGYESKCYVRKSSEPDEELNLVRRFVQELDRIWKLKQREIPSYIHEGYEKIEQITEQMKQRRAKFTEFFPLRRYKRTLDSFVKLQVFGFNSAKETIVNFAI